MLLAVLLPLLAQASMDPASPRVPDGISVAPNLPMIDRPSTLNRRGTEAAPPPPPNHLANCLAQADDDADSAIDTASDWLNTAQGAEKANANLCLGTAYVGLERWDEARAAFLAGRDAAAADDHLLRARLGMMAGNAALAGGAPVPALAALDAAQADAKAATATEFLSDIAVDRARALVLLKRPEDAATALAEARASAPNNAVTWLLSATLSRRMDHLAEAQGEIEAAARLAPTDPEVGLEAGLIAELSGHEDAARKSWQSVVAADPDGPVGHEAQDYLAEIGKGLPGEPALAPGRRPPAGDRPAPTGTTAP